MKYYHKVIWIFSRLQTLYGYFITTDSVINFSNLGLVLYKLLGYLTKMNKRKHMARQGLKQIGEHMNVVTRTMSADPSGNCLIILK